MVIICKKIGGKIRQQTLVYENQSKQIMKVRNQQVQTNRTIAISKLDIIICDNKQGTCILIDVAIPGDRNMIKREVEKIFKI